MKISKAEREKLKMKFGGVCAYCGQPLADRWHVDHIEAVEREMVFVREGHRTRLKPTGKFHRPERDCIENMNPACAPCNIDKHAMSLESWRLKLQRACDVLTRNNPTYRHAIRFGLLAETDAAVVFHFERAAQEPTP